MYTKKKWKKTKDAFCAAAAFAASSILSAAKEIKESCGQDMLPNYYFHFDARESAVNEFLPHSVDLLIKSSIEGYNNMVKLQAVLDCVTDDIFDKSKHWKYTLKYYEERAKELFLCTPERVESEWAALQK